MKCAACNKKSGCGLCEGMKVEFEHKDLYDMIKRYGLPPEEDFYKMIALAHLREKPDYYKLLKRYVES